MPHQLLLLNKDSKNKWNDKVNPTLYAHNMLLILHILLLCREWRWYKFIDFFCLRDGDKIFNELKELQKLIKKYHQ